jgi:hypothetical protein
LDAGPLRGSCAKRYKEPACGGEQSSRTVHLYERWSLFLSSNGRLLKVRIKRPHEDDSEEDKAVTEGSIAYYGTYDVNDGDKTIHVHIERSSFPNLNGTDGKRIVTTITADQMRYVNPARLAGGSITCAYKRAK